MTIQADWLKDIEREFADFIIELKEDVADGETHKVYVIEGYDIAIEFLNNRYNYYLKHYNNDIEKMDNFIYQNMVNELRVFANFSYGFIASKYDTDETKVNTIKKTLNAIVNNLEGFEI